MIPNIIRRHQNCKDRQDKDNKTSYSVMNGKQWYRTFVDSYFELGFSEIFIIMINFIPFIGLAGKILSMLPFIGGYIDNILWCFGFISGYVIINMYNQNNMDDMCYPEILNTGNEIARLIMGFVFCVISYIFAQFTFKGIKKNVIHKAKHIAHKANHIAHKAKHIAHKAHKLKNKITKITDKFSDISETFSVITDKK